MQRFNSTSTLANACRTRSIAAALIALCFLPSTLAITAASQSTVNSPSLPNAPLSDGRVTGTVTDATGALISGATITLRHGATTSATNSAADGTFLFVNVPSGPFTITASASGFTAATVDGTLSPGQFYDISSLILRPAALDVFVEAVSPKELAQMQVHAEEQQRVLGVLPNFFVAYDWNAQPLTPKQKFSLVVTTFRDPINVILAAGTAGVQQWQNDFAGYGQGAQGYGKRFGANYGSLVIGTALGGGVFPVLFHQDPRYFYKGTGSVHSRLFYALSTAVICRGDNGKRQPAFASILGDFSAGAVSNAYYPAEDRGSAGVTLENGLIAIGGDAIGNVVQEFIIRKFTPKSHRGVVNSATSESQKH